MRVDVTGAMSIVRRVLGQVVFVDAINPLPTQYEKAKLHIDETVHALLTTERQGKDRPVDRLSTG